MPGPLQWRHNGRDGVSPAAPLFTQPCRCRSKKTSKLCVTGICVGNSPVPGEFPAQMTSNAENVSIWWRHHTLSWPPIDEILPPVLIDSDSLILHSKYYGCWLLGDVRIQIISGDCLSLVILAWKCTFRRSGEVIKVPYAINRSSNDKTKHNPIALGLLIWHHRPRNIFHAM